MNPLLPINKHELELTPFGTQIAPFRAAKDMLIMLQLWVSVGWIRPIDQTFANFLKEQDPATKPTILLAAALTSYQLHHGHVCLDLTQALSEPELLLSLGYHYQQQPWHPKQIFANLTLLDWQHDLQNSFLVSSGTEQTPLVLHDTRLYLWRYWSYELLLIEQIKHRLCIKFTVPADLQQQLNELFKENKQSPDWQKIACAIACRSAFSIITGGPGTGKTTTVIRLLALLQSPAIKAGKPLNIQLAAPTGKAAARLTESISKQVASLPLTQQVKDFIPTNVSTIHRLLGSRPNTRHFRHNKTNPLALDILIIDEASMIDLELFAHLLEALVPQTRLILLGDKDQLASVEAGAVLGDLCRFAEQGHYSSTTLNWLTTYTGENLQHQNLVEGDDRQHPLAQQTVMLRHSRRFSSFSGIGQLATQVKNSNVRQARLLLNEGRKDLGLLQIKQLQDNSFVRCILTGYQEKDGLSYYLKLLNKHRPARQTPLYEPVWKKWANLVLTAFNQFQLLTVLREGPWGGIELNRVITYMLYYHGYISHYEGWYEGRPVLMTHNDYALGLMNGDIGITLAFPVENAPEQTVLKVVFPYNDGTAKLREVLPSRLSSAETVYAMTVHKSQGSEFSHTALLLPNQLNPVMCKELIYTAITRAKQRFTLIESDPQVFNQAIQKRTSRLSGLKF